MYGRVTSASAVQRNLVRRTKPALCTIISENTFVLLPHFHAKRNIQFGEGGFAKKKPDSTPAISELPNTFGPIKSSTLTPLLAKLIGLAKAGPAGRPRSTVA